MRPSLLLFLTAPLGLIVFSAAAFEGRITAALSRGEETQMFTYTVGLNTLRIERNETNWPYVSNLIALDSGDVTFLFPHNRSFVRLKSLVGNSASVSGLPMPLPFGEMPPGIGPGSSPAVSGAFIPSTSIGPTNLPDMLNLPKPRIPQMPNASVLPVGRVGGMPGGMSALPMMPMPGEALELTATGETTNLLGYACARYRIKQRGQIVDIWATDTLISFQPYLQSRLPRSDPPMIEERWGELLKARNIFPLLVTLKFENGPERLRFEVKTVTSKEFADEDEALFQPPADYHELNPLPF